MPKANSHSNTIVEVSILDAAIAGDAIKVATLISTGADPNSQDMRQIPWGITPLMHAARGGHVDVVKCLLRHKCNVNASTKHFPGEGQKETALHSAAKSGSIEAIRLLIEAKAKIDALSTVDGTPLAAAVCNGQAEAALFLLKSGADPNIKAQPSGASIIEGAAIRGDIYLLGELLKYGADINSKDQLGATPLMSILCRGSFEVSSFLIRQGADLQASDANGKNCLMWAVLGGNVDLVKLLLTNSISLNCLDNEKQSALDLAIRDEFTEIVSVFKSHGVKTGAELCPSINYRSRKR